MGTHNRAYVVRKFNPITDAQPPFNPEGRIDQLTTYAERTLKQQHEAVIDLVTTSAKSSNIAAAPRGVLFDVVNDLRLDTNDPIHDLAILNLRIKANTSSYDDLRAEREDVIESIRWWAEKSRLPGLRGWRFNAIKTPKYEHSAKDGCYFIKCEVILGTTVLYDRQQASICAQSDPLIVSEDVGTLLHALKQIDDAMYTEITYDHSIVGPGRAEDRVHEFKKRGGKLMRSLQVTTAAPGASQSTSSGPAVMPTIQPIPVFQDPTVDAATGKPIVKFQRGNGNPEVGTTVFIWVKENGRARVLESDTITALRHNGFETNDEVYIEVHDLVTQ